MTFIANFSERASTLKQLNPNENKGLRVAHSV